MSAEFAPEDQDPNETVAERPAEQRRGQLVHVSRVIDAWAEDTWVGEGGPEPPDKTPKE